MNGYTVDRNELIWLYYQEVRDLIELGAERRPPLGLAGRNGFVSLSMPDAPIGLIAHERILESLGDPEALLGAQRTLAEDWIRLQSAEQDPRLSVGLDGVGLFAPTLRMSTFEAGEG